MQIVAILSISPHLSQAITSTVLEKLFSQIEFPKTGILLSDLHGGGHKKNLESRRISYFFKGNINYSRNKRVKI